MFKKVVLTLVVIMAVGSLFSCNKKGLTDNAESSSETTVKATEKVEFVAKSGINIVMVDNSDVEDGYTYQTITYPKFVYSGNEKIKNIFDELSKEIEDEALEFKDFNKDAIREYIENQKDSEDFIEGAQFSHTAEAKVTRNDDNYISLTVTTNDFTMGAHGTYYISGYTYDARSGNRVKLYDLIKDKEELRTYLKTWCKGNSSYDFFDEYETAIDSYVDEENELQFYISGNAITVIFQIYDIAPYAAGAIEIPLERGLYK